MGGTFEHLADVQKTRFIGVMGKLEKLDVPELLAESSRLRLMKPMPEEQKPRYRSNFAGAIAAQKVIAYVNELIAANTLRRDLGEQIMALNARANDIESSDPVEADTLRFAAGRLAGEQEVAIHRFANAIQRIRIFLRIAGKSAGHKIPSTPLKFLESYEPLRDYYEHLEQRLPGGMFQSEACVEPPPGDTWWIRMELPINPNDGYIEIRGKRIDVSSDAVMDVVRIVEEFWEELKTRALAETQKHFLEHPDQIPDPSEVREVQLVALGGVLPHWERWRKGEM